MFKMVKNLRLKHAYRIRSWLKITELPQSNWQKFIFQFFWQPKTRPPKQSESESRFFAQSERFATNLTKFWPKIWTPTWTGHVKPLNQICAYFNLFSKLNRFSNLILKLKVHSYSSFIMTRSEFSWGKSIWTYKEYFI